MKKLIALLLALVMVLSMTACLWSIYRKYSTTAE